MTVTKVSHQLDHASFFVRFVWRAVQGRWKNEKKKEGLDILDNIVQLQFPFSAVKDCIFRIKNLKRTGYKSVIS